MPGNTTENRDAFFERNKAQIITPEQKQSFSLFSGSRQLQNRSGMDQRPKTMKRLMPRH